MLCIICMLMQSCSSHYVTVLLQNKTSLLQAHVMLLQSLADVPIVYAAFYTLNCRAHAHAA